MLELINSFKNREIKAKNIFEIRKIEKNVAYDFIRKYHYLGDARFFSTYSYGLYIGTEIVGCATYSSPQGISSLKSWFGLGNDVLDILELMRLCVIPILNGSNTTSYLLGNSIKFLKKEKIRAVITLADDSKHVGSIYQVCNFKYYGITNKKTDFYSHEGKLNPRGSTRNLRGVWLPRTQKHRYCYFIDDKLKCLLDEKVRPSLEQVKKYDCCKGTNEVYDDRFGDWYKCPRCCDKIEKIIK